MKLSLFVLFIVSFFTVFSQPYGGGEKVKVKQNSTKAAQCTPPTTTTYLDLNNVRAMVHTAGNLWQKMNNFIIKEWDF